MDDRRPSLEILRKRADFLLVASSGTKWVAPEFILQISRVHAELNVVRLGFTASKKVGNSVIRNRARRRLRALAAEVMPQARSNYDYVFVARPSTPKCGFDQMRQSLIKGMKRMKVWRDG